MFDGTNSTDRFLHRSAILRYGIAIFCILAALALRMAVDSCVGDRLPYVTFFVAVTVTAWFGGLWPALLAAVLGYLAADWFFVPPRYSLFIMTIADAADVAGYAMVSLAIVFFSHRMHLARAAALSRQRQLAMEIEHRIQTEERLQQAKETAESSARRADEATQAKDRFLAVLSHELRTPLTPVLATVSMLETDQRLDDDLRQDMEIIRRNVELEARLIDNLLDLTRIVHGKLELREEVADMHALLEHAMSVSCHSDAMGKQLQVRRHLKAIEHHVRGDPARLEQILWNLLNNAVKFTHCPGA